MPERPRTAFDRLHATLQEALYRMRWTKLRPIQVDAIHEILDGGKRLDNCRENRMRGKPRPPFFPSSHRSLENPIAVSA